MAAVVTRNGFRRLWPVIALALVVAAAGMSAGSAEAFRIGGRAWTKRTVTYRIAVARYRTPMTEAARQWNESGVRLRFREVRSGRADIVVRTLPVRPGAPCLGVTGRATVGAVGPGQGFLLLHPGCTNTQLISVATHELGHVLGLGHSQRACALMAFDGGARCAENRSVLPWEVVCRGLRADDLAGAIRRYGGVARPLPTDRICVTRPTPGPVTGVGVEVNPGGTIAATRISWTNPVSGALERVVVNRHIGACPTSPLSAGSWSLRPGITRIDGDFVGAAPAASGAPQSLLDPEGTVGRVCYAVWSVGPSNRWRQAATMIVDHPGLSVDPARIALTGSVSLTVGVHLAWQNPADPGIDSVRILSVGGACPANPADFSGFSTGVVAATPGPATFDDPTVTIGPVCYGIVFVHPGFLTPAFLVQVG